jgi:hypothetical protein
MLRMSFYLAAQQTENKGALEHVRFIDYFIMGKRHDH